MDISFFFSSNINIALSSCSSSNPPGFAFILYKYGEDAEAAVRSKSRRFYSTHWSAFLI